MSDDEVIGRQAALAKAIHYASLASSDSGARLASPSRADVAQAWAAVAFAFDSGSCTCSRTTDARLTEAIEKNAVMRHQIKNIISALEMGTDSGYVLDKLREVLNPCP